MLLLWLLLLQSEVEITKPHYWHIVVVVFITKSLKSKTNICAQKKFYHIQKSATEPKQKQTNIPQKSSFSIETMRANEYIGRTKSNVIHSSPPKVNHRWKNNNNNNNN